MPHRSRGCWAGANSRPRRTWLPGGAMAKTLLIVESPAKAKTIGKYLGPSYIVRASMGHVRDLPRRTLGVDLADGFKPAYEISAEKGKTVAALRRAVREADAVLLATDPDREGEAIAWHVAIATGVPRARARRVVFHEFTAGAVRSAEFGKAACGG